MSRTATDRTATEPRLPAAASIRTFDDACRFLMEDLPKHPQILLKDAANLDRGKRYLAKLGNPQDTFRSIHIAGTSGKTSTAWLTASILQAHGFKTGLYLSPHAYDIRERFMVNMTLIGKRGFVEAVKRQIPVINRMSLSQFGRPGRFEAITAIAFQLFADERVDYAVIETGIGGRYDVTNTITRPDKLAVITRIGLHHRQRLGNTLEAIANQKAGILPLEGVGVVWQPTARAERQIRATARRRRTNLTWVTGIDFQVPSWLPAPQLENASVALAAARRLADRDGWQLKVQRTREMLGRCQVPGRFERRQVGGREVWLDGAHNLQKLRAAAQAVRQSFKRRPVVVAALGASKDHQALLAVVARFADHIILTGYSDEQAQFAGKSAVPVDLARCAHELGLNRIEIVDNPTAAVWSAIRRAEPDQPVFATGSISMLAEINRALT